jgi:GTPase
VPPGTQVTSWDGGVHDLVVPGQRAVIARGGSGGRGNKRFAAATRQAPRFAERGLDGAEGWIDLQLKLLADVGLVGLPNAGKSSLLARLTRAAPKVADYPFTTLQPVLGTVESPDGRQLVVADVPGLIEGASEGVGLGHDFLAHLERARTLVHVIDASKDADEQWRAIDAELVAYGAGLEARPQIVVLNKVDLEPEPRFAVEDERIVGVFRLSCATGEGLDEFRRSLFALVPDGLRPLVTEDDDRLVDYLVYRPEPKARPWTLFRTERGFRVVGTPPGEEELERALRAAGAKRGASVEIGEETLELA